MISYRAKVYKKTQRPPIRSFRLPTRYIGPSPKSTSNSASTTTSVEEEECMIPEPRHGRLIRSIVKNTKGLYDCDDPRKANQIETEAILTLEVEYEVFNATIGQDIHIVDKKTGRAVGTVAEFKLAILLKEVSGRWI